MKKYCRLCKKKEERNQCGYGPTMWDKYSVDDANDDEIQKAAEDSGITSGDGGEGVGAAFKYQGGVCATKTERIR